MKLSFYQWQHLNRMWMKVLIKNLNKFTKLECFFFFFFKLQLILLNCCLFNLQLNLLNWCYRCLHFENNRKFWLILIWKICCWIWIWIWNCWWKYYSIFFIKIIKMGYERSMLLIVNKKIFFLEWIVILLSHSFLILWVGCLYWKWVLE